MIATLFSSGHIADIIIGVLALEALGIVAIRRLTGRGFALITLLPNMCAGGCLVLALRAALVSADWTWTALALVGAFAAHIWDLASRR